MKPAWIFLLLTLASQTACMAQHPPQNLPPVSDEAFDKELKGLLRFSVPVMGVNDLKGKLGQVVLLDAREEEEFETSHLPGARLVGYDHFQMEAVQDLPRDTTIVVYCSVGYRSERIAERLREAGYEKVYNLYGGIFEWVNQGLPVETATGNPTRQVHTYNKRWSKWIRNPEVKKVW